MVFDLLLQFLTFVEVWLWLSSFANHVQNGPLSYFKAFVLLMDRILKNLPGYGKLQAIANPLLSSSQTLILKDSLFRGVVIFKDVCHFNSAIFYERLLHVEGLRLCQIGVAYHQSLHLRHNDLLHHVAKCDLCGLLVVPHVCLESRLHLSMNSPLDIKVAFLLPANC